MEHFRPARILVMVALLAAPGPAFTQYYTPFQATSRKAYMDLSGLGRVYSLTFDSATVDGADSLYHHFGRLNDTSTFESPFCPGWGNPYCLPTDLPEWSGGLFRTDGNGTYLLGNVFGDTLTLELAMNAGDTSTVYLDATQRFALVREALDTMTVMGYQDSVITYRILHLDPMGTPIASPLHMAPLSVGKILGLTRFFQVDSFPQVLKPLELIGNKGPDLGMHRITSGMLYDHQPGDVLQTHYTAHFNGGPPPNTFDTYTIVTFTGRTDTPDSIHYQTATSSFDVLNGTSSNTTGTLSYPKFEVRAEIPFERFGENAYHNELSREELCGVPYWTFDTYKALYLFYCADDQCYTFGDTQGPDTEDERSYAIGLGDTRIYAANTGTGPFTGFASSTSLNYFVKDGFPCGSLQSVGMEELEQSSVVAFPDPTTGPMQLRGVDTNAPVRVYDAVGRQASEAAYHASAGMIDLSNEPAGIYVVEATATGGQQVRIRVLVAR